MVKFRYCGCIYELCLINREKRFYMRGTVVVLHQSMPWTPPSSHLGSALQPVASGKGRCSETCKPRYPRCSSSDSDVGNIPQAYFFSSACLSPSDSPFSREARQFLLCACSRTLTLRFPGSWVLIHDRSSHLYIFWVDQQWNPSSTPAR